MRPFAVLALLALGIYPTSAEAQSAGSGVGVEDMYLARSLRLSRVAPTSYCARDKVGFAGSTAEDQYTFHSASIRGSDGLSTSAHVAVIGTLHACFGPAGDPLTRNFYAEGVLGGVAFTGRGECRTVKEDFPEKGITVSRCFLDLTGLPSGYRGGQLTTNTVVSGQGIGEVTAPPGYVQASMAIVRLWKTRQP